MTEYLISEKRLLGLLEKEAKLLLLENGGVDNWEWIEESLEDLEEDYSYKLSEFKVYKPSQKKRGMKTLK